MAMEMRQHRPPEVPQLFCLSAHELPQRCNWGGALEMLVELGCGGCWVKLWGSCSGCGTPEKCIASCCHHMCLQRLLGTLGPRGWCPSPHPVISWDLSWLLSCLDSCHVAREERWGWDGVL